MQSLGAITIKGMKLIEFWRDGQTLFAKGGGDGGAIEVSDLEQLSKDLLQAKREIELKMKTTTGAKPWGSWD
jgi:hypothetical protein